MCNIRDYVTRFDFSGREEGEAADILAPFHPRRPNIRIFFARLLGNFKGTLTHPPDATTRRVLESVIASGRGEKLL